MQLPVTRILKLGNLTIFGHFIDFTILVCSKKITAIYLVYKSKILRNYFSATMFYFVNRQNYLYLRRSKRNKGGTLISHRSHSQSHHIPENSPHNSCRESRITNCDIVAIILHLL